MFVLGLYGSVNEVMSSRSVNSGTVPGQASRPSKHLTSTKQGRPRQ